METGPCDLLFVSYIIRDRSPFLDTFRVSAAGAAKPDPKDLICTLSPRHSGYRWVERTRAAGARMVAAYGGGIEIGADYFCDSRVSEDPYRLLIPAPKEECMGGFERAEMRGLYPIRDIDLPVAGLSFCADDDYLRAITPALTGATCLSRIVRALSNGASRHVRPQSGWNFS